MSKVSCLLLASGVIGGYAVQGVIAEEIGLSNQSPADVAICKTKISYKNQKIF